MAEVKLPITEVQVMGEIFGIKYGLRSDLDTPGKSRVETVEYLVSAVRNTLILRLKYPDISEEELEEKMRTGDKS